MKIESVIEAFESHKTLTLDNYWEVKVVSCEMSALTERPRTICRIRLHELNAGLGFEMNHFDPDRLTLCVDK